MGFFDCGRALFGNRAANRGGGDTLFDLALNFLSQFDKGLGRGPGLKLHRHCLLEFGDSELAVPLVKALLSLHLNTS